MRRLLLSLALAASLAALAPAAAGARPHVPASFFGVLADGPLLGRTDAQLTSEFQLMRSSGAGTVRIVVYWADAQPAAPGSALPAGWTAGRGGVPTDLAPVDRLFAQAARQRLDVLPVVVRAPAWDRVQPDTLGSPPGDDAAYGNFLATLVDRYGPHGSFWAQHPELPRRPQRTWQLWNEPDITMYWSVHRNWAKSYVALLRAGRGALRAADPGARVVLAGLANFSWKDLDAVYRAGGRGLFDVAAVHPFTRRPQDAVRIVRYNRQVMARHRDARKPVMVTELSWPADQGKVRHPLGIETTLAGQATRLRAAYRALAAKRRAYRIDTVVWSTWMAPDYGSQVWWDWSGLRRLDPKNPAGAAINTPALAAFRAVARSLER